MKKSLIAALSIVSVAVAHGAEWKYHLPESGIAPSYISATILSSMGERHGGSELGMQTYEITLPLSDPRQTSYADWAINAQLDMRFTHIDASGSLSLEHEKMYSASLPVTFLRNYPSGNRLSMTLAPALASDFGGTNRYADVVGGSTYTIRYSPTFSYTLGMGVSPRFASYAVVPMIGFSWQAHEDWDISLRFYRLCAMYKVNDTVSVGPFLGGYNHSWMVNTSQGDRIFRFRSLVAGVTAEYDFSRPGQTKRIITASIGSTLASSAQFCRRNAKKDAVETHHYKPGLFFALGVDFRF